MRFTNNLYAYGNREFTFYTFIESDNERVILKRLEDNKIFYNGVIYDENFFDYDRLNRFVTFINYYRDHYINQEFKRIFDRERYNGGLLKVPLFTSGIHDVWEGLTQEQYEILVRAYKYDFPFVPIEDISNNTDFILEDVELLMALIPKKKKNDYYDDEYEDENEEQNLEKNELEIKERPHFRSLIRDRGQVLKEAEIEAEDHQNFRKLIRECLYPLGWRAIKPVYPVFKRALYKYYNDSDDCYIQTGTINMYKTKWWYRDEVGHLDAHDEFLWLDEPQWWLCYIGSDGHVYTISPRVKRLRQYEGVHISYEDWFRPNVEDFKREDIFEKIRRDWKKVDDGKLYFTENSSPDNLKTLKNIWLDEYLINKHEDIYNPIHNPVCEGTRLRSEWLEYDEQKKFDEFNINCMTNSYHMRYKYYNEIGWKDYPEEKKFKTDSFYEFTEDEIKANFENMIDGEKPAIERWNFVVNNTKNVTYLIDFLKKLERVRMFYKVAHYYDENWWYEEDDNDTAVYEKTVNRLYEILNDPQYILVMPLLDAFFDIYRVRSYMQGDNTFTDFELEDSYMITESRLVYVSMNIFELSLERQDFLNSLDSLVIDDWFEDDAEDYSDITEDGQVVVLVAGFFIWLLICTLYFGITCLPLGDAIFFNREITSSFAMSFKDYLNHRPQIYYGLELRRPRLRMPFYSRYKMPETFFEDINYRFFKRRARGMLPFSVMEILDNFIDQDDACLGIFDSRLRESAVKRGYDWRLETER